MKASYQFKIIKNPDEKFEPQISSITSDDLDMFFYFGLKDGKV